MGKGDKKSKKGKRFRHSYGKTRLHKKKNAPIIKKKIEERPKPVEQKKQPKPEIVHDQPIVTQVVEEMKIVQPQITEIKEEVQIPEIKETPVSVVPEVVKEEINEEPKPVLQEIASPKTESKEIQEKPVADAPKKRGRPKKKE